MNFKLGAFFAVGLSIAVAAPALAQDAGTVAFGRTIYKDKADCAYCHGWSGNGVGDPRSEKGANLRATALDREQILEVARCGRPATGMPHHDRLAYTDKRCYGMTADEIGKAVPPEAAVPLAARELQAVTDYIMAKIKGLTTEPLYAECTEFFAAGVPQCDAFKK